MTDQVEKQADPMEDFILKFEFPVKSVNAILQVLANTPYVVAAPLVAMIHEQGEPQFKAALEAESNKEA